MILQGAQNCYLEFFGANWAHCGSVSIPRNDCAVRQVSEIHSEFSGTLFVHLPDDCQHLFRVSRSSWKLKCSRTLLTKKSTCMGASISKTSPINLHTCEGVLA